MYCSRAQRIHKMKSTKNEKTALRLCICALFMAMNIALSLFGVPLSPVDRIYLSDIVICVAAILFDPISAFAVGGFGAFLGDAFSYPSAMFVSLAVHGLQALIISAIAHKVLKKHSLAASIIGVSVGAVIMVIGYTLGCAFVYGTPEYAILSIPLEILQATVGAVVSIIICYPLKLKRKYDNYICKK